MTTTKSSRNPFRDPVSSWLSPLVHPTHASSQTHDSSSSSSAPSIAHTQSAASSTAPGTGSLNATTSIAAAPNTTPGTQYSPPPGPPPPSASQPSSSTAHPTPAPPQPPSSSSSQSAASGTFGLDDELPPAYTPSADVYGGEQTVEYGPARPFQAPPTHPISQLRPPAAPLNQQSSTSQNRPPLTQNSTGSSQRLGSFLTQLAELAINRPSPSARPANQHYAPPAGPPPPQHPSHVSPPRPTALPARRHDSPSPTPSGSRPVPPTANSDFARDFYAAGAVIPGEGNPEGFFDLAGQPPTSPPVLGKPTTTPTPGHPYLHDGKLLVYPRGFECTKCRNIGYKLPSLKPCKRCWPKYARPFTGPLAYSFSNPDMTQGDLETSSNLQRPLPPPPPIGPRRDPPLPSPTSPSYPGLAPAHPRLSPGGMFNMGLVTPGPPRPTLLTPPSQNLHPLFSPSAGPSRYRHGSGPAYGGRPPPGAIVYPAGDPRLGGRVCWRCDGQGTVSFMLVDREQCGVCGGVGRVYP